MATVFVENRDGSYLLGAIHGDGYVGERSIEIAIGGKFSDYADAVEMIWRRIGYEPKRYVDKRGLIKIAIHNRDLSIMLSAYKRRDWWDFPILPTYPQDYLAGLIDTDGFVSSGRKRYRVNITQKAGLKLPRIRPILDALGFDHIEIKRRDNNKVRGKIYPIDVIWWNKQDDVLRLADLLDLRNPPKAQRLRLCVKRIEDVRDNNKRYHILRVLRETGGTTIPDICGRLGYERGEVLYALNALRRQSRVTRNDPPIDSLVWHWVDTNKNKE